MSRKCNKLADVNQSMKMKSEVKINDIQDDITINTKMKDLFHQFKDNLNDT